MKLIKNSALHILILTSLVTYAYWPFISNISLNIGGSDARWYQYILHDAIIQLAHGIFPTYVGQSEFSFFGGPVIRAPYYLLLGQLIHVLTFNQLNALCIQHLTVLFSAYSAALLTYFLLIKLAPHLKWLGLSLAFFYVSCPGIMSLIYRYDMYYSFMAIPYVPLVIYGLIRAYQKNDSIAYIITAIGLSLTWMSHPPIALWTTAVCFLFYGIRFILLRKGLRGLLIIGLLFLLLNFWQFISIFSLKIGNQYVDVPKSNPALILQLLKDAIPGIFLPLQMTTNSFLPFFQLGYSFWLILFISLFLSFRMLNNFLIQILLTCVLFFLLLLYPLPLISHGLWSILLIPQIVATTIDCPMFRLYVILAALISFIAIITLNGIYTSNKLRVKNTIFLILITLTSWNLYQASYFVNSLSGNNNTWIDAKNIYFTPGQTLQYTLLSDGNYDPSLKNQILNSAKIPMSSYDNEQFIIKKCFESSNTKYLNLITPKDQNVSTWPPLFTFDSVPNKQYILCLNIKALGINSMSWRINGNFFAAQANAGKKNIAVPFFISNSSNKKITINLDSFQSATPIEIIKAGLISYNSEELPIGIDSYTPYKATVTTSSDNNYLKVFKSFYPGYEAKVNDEIVPVIESENHTIIIPLKKKGFQQVKLQYIGFPIMKIAFFISTIAWCIILFYLATLLFPTLLQNITYKIFIFRKRNFLTENN